MKLHLLAGPETAVPPEFGDVEIRGITADSREARPGWLFAALPGLLARFRDAVERDLTLDPGLRDRLPPALIDAFLKLC